MADLVAQGIRPENRWRRTLPTDPVTLGRVAPRSDWDAPWDQKISSLHATLTWHEGKLEVRRHPRGRNPIFFGGVAQDEFTVSDGETFVIGETTFTVREGETLTDQSTVGWELRSPDAELSWSSQELRAIKYVDPDDRIEALSALPEVIRSSASDHELANGVVNVLLKGVPRADAAAVVRLASGDGADEGPIEVCAASARYGDLEQFKLSRRLVRAAVSQRRQSVLHRWDIRNLHPEFTAHLAVDWAICAPLPTDLSPGWGLYLAGRLPAVLAVDPGRSEQELLTSDLKFAEVVADLLGSLRQVRELQAERVQLHTSLRVAQEVQADFFPRSMPRVPGYELAARTRSADVTGGDYHDVIPLPSGRVGLVVADVCGHGLGPSLLMASVRAVLRGFAGREPDPEVLVGDLNHALFDDLVPRHRFITLLYGALAPTEHRFHYANAGHGPVVFHLPAGTGQFLSLVEDAARGCPLGILREGYRACDPVALAPGDLLVLGTDGIVETRRGSEPFGMQRLADFLLARRDQPLQETLDELVEEVTAFHERGRPDDDLTLMLVRRL
jgi:serine phosphatase RsbU (regulator of sigma subunit)